MKLETAIHDFLVAHRVDNCTPRAIGYYSDSLRYFSTWLESTHKIVDVEDLRLAHLREWISYLQETPSRRGKKRSDETIRSYGRALLAFCRWLEQEDVIEKPI